MRTSTGEALVTRAVRVIAAFSQDEPALRVSEIARRTGLHVATASRLVGQLVDEGLLSRDGDRRVRIGVRLWELATRASPTLSLRDAAMPAMVNLHGLVGHHVQLCVLSGDDVLCVERLSVPAGAVSFATIAGRWPVHASSCGLVLVAYAGNELEDRVLTQPMATYTLNTMTSPTEVRAALEKVRRDGYAHLPGHLHEASAGVAVPVRGRRGDVAAALGVIVPLDTDPRAVVPMLLLASRAISRRLGFPRWDAPFPQGDRLIHREARRFPAGALTSSTRHQIRRDDKEGARP